MSKCYPHPYTRILLQCGNGALLFRGRLVSSHCFEPVLLHDTMLFLSCAGWYHLCRHRKPAGSPNTAFPFGLRVRGLLLPLSCHTLLGMLSILQGTDVRAYLQSRPAVCPSSSTGRLLKQSKAPSCVRLDRQWDHTRGANWDATSLWAWFPLRGLAIRSLGWWATPGVGHSLHPSCLLCYGLSNTTVCTELGRSNRASELTLGYKSQPNFFLFNYHTNNILLEPLEKHRGVLFLELKRSDHLLQSNFSRCAWSELMRYFWFISNLQSGRWRAEVSFPPSYRCQVWCYNRNKS